MVSCESCNLDLCQDCLQVKFKLPSQYLGENKWHSNKENTRERPEKLTFEIDKRGMLTGNARQLDLNGYRYGKYLSFEVRDED